MAGRATPQRNERRGAPASAPTPCGARPAARTYAGIGAREVPAAILTLIGDIAARRAADGWVLRSGGSPGADQAFLRGARSARGRAELYLPWPGFEAASWREENAGGGGPPDLVVLEAPSEGALELARDFHPRFGSLDGRQQRLLARDGHEVLGADLASPVALVICWTADGSIDGAGLYDDGTGQALRIAAAHSIPVLNLTRPEHRERAGRDQGHRQRAD